MVTAYGCVKYKCSLSKAFCVLSRKFLARIVNTNNTLIKVIITLPAAKGEHTLEGNNDITIISRRWL